MIGSMLRFYGDDWFNVSVSACAIGTAMLADFPAPSVVGVINPELAARSTRQYEQGVACGALRCKGPAVRGLFVFAIGWHFCFFCLTV